jgi:hypothetical protein
VDVEARAVREVELTTGAGTFATIEVALRVLQKDSEEDTTQGTIWFSRDARRLPVRMRVAAPVGAVEASLRRAAGTVAAGLAAGTTRGDTEAAP